MIGNGVLDLKEDREGKGKEVSRICEDFLFSDGNKPGGFLRPGGSSKVKKLLTWFGSVFQT